MVKAGTATPEIRPGVVQETEDKPRSGLEPGYLVICWNDPVNFMAYVTHVFQVGKWIRLGSPEEKVAELNEKTAPDFAAMETAGYFEAQLLDALGGET
jgi:hypothetical protein